MTFVQRYDADNIFAKIIRGEMACIKAYEDELILAFMDIFPQSDGHTLVIPKKPPATSFFDNKPSDLSDLIIGVQKVAKAVDAALSPDGVRIIQFNGSEAGQTVFHIHFHIIPVYAGVALGRHGDGAPAEASKLQALAAKIAAHF